MLSSSLLSPSPSLLPPSFFLSFLPFLCFFFPLYQHLEYWALKLFDDAFRTKMTCWLARWFRGGRPCHQAWQPESEPTSGRKELNPVSCPLTYTCPVVLVPPINRHKKKLNSLVILQLRKHYRSHPLRMSPSLMVFLLISLTGKGIVNSFLRSQLMLLY